MSMGHEFIISFKDLAIAEVHLDFLIRETQNAVDASVETIGKMKIEIDSIKQPTLQVISKMDEFAESMKSEFSRIKVALEEKKAELLKTEQDFSDYDVAMAEARRLAETDLKAETQQFKKATNPLA